MDIWSMVMLTVAATSDSLVIGFNYGVKGVRINYIANLFISCLCFFGTALSMQLGRMLGAFISQRCATVIGGVILLGLGCFMLLSGLRKRQNSAIQDPQSVDKDNSSVIELRESVLMGVLLSLNNMGLGIGAGFAGLPTLPTAALCGAASFLFIGTGMVMGQKMQRMRIGRMLELGSALLVMLLGAMELLG